MRQEVQNEYGETVVRVDREDIGKITEAEMEMLREAKNIPYVYDKDCPPMSEKLKERMTQRIAENAKMTQSA